MQRRKFLPTAEAATSLSASATTISPVSTGKSFTVKAGKDRFNEPILYQGINPNLVKIPASDTGGQLAVFDYEGFDKIGPPLHMHLHQDDIFYVVEGGYSFRIGSQAWRRGRPSACFQAPRRRPSLSQHQQPGIKQQFTI